MLKIQDMFMSNRKLRLYSSEDEKLKYESTLDKSKTNYTATKVIISNEFYIDDDGDLVLFEVDGFKVVNCNGKIKLKKG